MIGITDQLPRQCQICAEFAFPTIACVEPASSRVSDTPGSMLEIQHPKSALYI